MELKPTLSGKTDLPIDSRFYRTLQRIARWMDTYYLDPILGLLLPAGIGDFVSALMALPFIVFSLFVAKSIPLTLAVINHTLWDIFIGLIPFFVGDVLDVFSRPYRRNLQLIEGYLSGDKSTIRHIQKHVAITLFAIFLCCTLIYFMFKAVLWFGDFFMEILY
ncbi:MAG: DUF4112 domain-containing protein [Bacteroidaceae bacterium]|nr:DUF4112 domain-containing protein [Bacteroidaceae bacterium]